MHEEVSKLGKYLEGLDDRLVEEVSKILNHVEHHDSESVTTIRKMKNKMTEEGRVRKDMRK